MILFHPSPYISINKGWPRGVSCWTWEQLECGRAWQATTRCATSISCESQQKPSGKYISCEWKVYIVWVANKTPLESFIYIAYCQVLGGGKPYQVAAAACPLLKGVFQKCNNNETYNREVLMVYMKTRSLGALRTPTSRWRPFGPLDFVLRCRSSRSRSRSSRNWGF